MLEFEKKIQLTEDEFCCLRDLAGKNDAIVQKNYYYDTDGFTMNDRGITCRIREKNGKYIATIKEHRLGISSCSRERSLEARSELDDSFFTRFGVKPKGCLTTERAYLNMHTKAEIALDKNTYLDTVDYELEIEYPFASSISARRILKIIGLLLCGDSRCLLSRAKHSKNKSQRFFERLKKMKNVN